jgi:hypothetical protein
VRLEEETSNIIADPFGDLLPTFNTLGDISLLDMAPSSEYDRMM